MALDYHDNAIYRSAFITFIILLISSGVFFGYQNNYVFVKQTRNTCYLLKGLLNYIFRLNFWLKNFLYY